MKISISQLRKAIREVLKEEMNEAPLTGRPTVPAHSSSGEQQFNQDIGGKRWGKNDRTSAPSKGADKVTRVFTLIAQTGALANMASDQRTSLRSELEQFMASKSPADKLITPAEQLADEFMKSRGQQAQ